MGFTFAVIASDKAFSKDSIDDFTFKLRMPKLRFIKQVTFEEAMDINFNDNTYFDIGFFPQGTLMFYSDPSIENRISLERNSFEGKSAKLLADETSMSFVVDFYENTQQTINLLEHEGKVHNLFTKNDRPFRINYTDGFDLIIKSIGDIIKIPFEQIDSTFPMFRYTISGEKLLPEQVSQESKDWSSRLKEYRRLQMQQANNGVTDTLSSQEKNVVNDLENKSLFKRLKKWLKL